MTVGSVLWGASAERASLEFALLAAAVGTAARLLLHLPFPLPEASATLDDWNHWPKPMKFIEPDEGPVLVTIEYKIAPGKAKDFLKAIHNYQRIRRRDGAMRWGVYYDSESPGVYVEIFLVDSWAEHQRQHDCFSLANRVLEDQGLGYAIEQVRIRHLVYARK
jgi:Transmembrane secretion effector